MKLAATIGISVNEFWDMTLDELNLYARIYVDKQKQEFKDKVTLAYQNAMWTIQWLSKNKPEPLSKILDNLYKEKKEMTDEQMLQQVKMLNKLFGGEEILDKNGNIV